MKQAMMISEKDGRLLTVIGGWLVLAAMGFGCLAAVGEEAAPPERVERLVRQLGDPDYFTRQRAQDELARLGFEAFDALSAAADDADAEIAARAKYLLQSMRMHWVHVSDLESVKRTLEGYETLDAESRRNRMVRLAALPGGEGAAALCRLVRYEQSVLLSKSAALALLRAFSTDETFFQAAGDAVQKDLAGCKRPGALWLSAWVRADAESDAAFDALVREEQSLWKQSPDQTDARIVAWLIRVQSLRLKRLGRMDAALAALERLVEVEPGQPDTLHTSLVWLIDQKAWGTLDRLADRFSKTIAANAGLLYLMAESEAARGKTDRAEETAARAFALPAGGQDMQLFQHYLQAKFLRKRGRFEWARREYEHVADQGDVMRHGVDAWNQLAEMLHDQGRDLEAAAVVEKLLAQFQKLDMAQEEWFKRHVNSIRSRKDFFLACHWESRNDRPKQREALDAALQAESPDVDALIACYRLPGQTPEYRADVAARIRRAVEEYREELSEDPHSAARSNMLAWLIGNTEGDLDLALECAVKATELEPEEGGIRATLARVYFARGDLQRAVAEQTKAAELEPHSNLIRRQLEEFRKALAAKQGESGT